MSKHRKRARHSQQNHTVDSITRLSYGRSWSDCEYEQLEHETNWKRHHRDDLTWNDEAGRRAGKDSWCFRKPRNGWKDQTKRARQYKPKDHTPVEKTPHSYCGGKRTPHNRYYWRNYSYPKPFCVIHGVTVFGRTCPITRDDAFWLNAVAKEKGFRVELDLTSDYSVQDFNSLLDYVQQSHVAANSWDNTRFYSYQQINASCSRWYGHVVLKRLTFNR